MDKGFIMLPRTVFDDPHFKDADFVKAYIYIYYLARYKETVIDGVEVGKNQILISKPKLAEILQCTLSQVRTILNKLEGLGGITRENIANRYSLITLTENFINGTFDNSRKPEKKKKEKEGKTGKEHYSISDSYDELPFSQEEKFSEMNSSSGQCGEVFGCGEEGEGEEEKKYASERAEAYMTSGEVKEEDTEAYMTSGEEKWEKAQPYKKWEEENEEKAQAYKNPGEAKPEKEAFGRFSNVFLTRSEYDDFCREVRNANYYIEDLSATFANSEGRSYKNHYALLYKNYLKDKNENRKGGNPLFFEDRPPSYAVLRAEQKALTETPKLKKKKKK